MTDNETKYSPEALALKRKYAAEWRARNREHIRAYQRKWYKDHPGKNAEYQRNYWEKLAANWNSESGGAAE